MTLQLLIDAVVSDVVKRFPPDVKEIKKRVESLIEREVSRGAIALAALANAIMLMLSNVVPHARRRGEGCPALPCVVYCCENGGTLLCCIPRLLCMM